MYTNTYAVDREHNTFCITEVSQIALLLLDDLRVHWEAAGNLLLIWHGRCIVDYNCGWIDYH